MATTPKPADAAASADTEKQEEARNVARDAVAEMRAGNKEEAKFLADEAKSLDPKAAADVLKDAPRGGKA